MAAPSLAPHRCRQQPLALGFIRVSSRVPLSESRARHIPLSCAASTGHSACTVLRGLVLKTCSRPRHARARNQARTANARTTAPRTHARTHPHTTRAHTHARGGGEGGRGGVQIPRLFLVDPSGSMVEWKAVSIGR